MHSSGLLLLALATFASAVPQLPSSHSETRHKPCHGFVTTTKDGHFKLGSRKFDFRSFNMPGFTGDQPFEVTDGLRSLAALASPVFRSYTLGITSIHVNETRAFIQGYDHKTNKWIFNEAMFKNLDYGLAQAAKLGVKVIMPITNADYGSVDTNWVGNYVDLIRHRYNIDDYQEARTKVDFFTDKKMRQAYKDIASYVLKRRNTVNGRIYGHDDTFMAFQTGNELNGGGPQRGEVQSVPGGWTHDVARHIKSLAPRTLVVDGTFSRTASAKTAWALEALQSPYVDVFSYHYYASSDMAMARPMAKYVKSFGKTFIVGEYGFFNESPEDYVKFNSKAYADVAGMLVWSLRPHAANGGFLTHSEGDDQYSWHVPGWKTPIAPEFMPNEDSVVDAIYSGSYKIVNKHVAPKPVPVAPPNVTVIQNSTHTGLTFQGSAWAQHYELWSANWNELKFGIVSKSIQDNVQAGTLFIAVNPSNATQTIHPHYKPIKIQHKLPIWKDTKWSFKRDHIINRRDDATVAQQAVSFSPVSDQGGIVKRAAHSGASVKGAWYALRGVNQEGKKGKFSKPFFIHA